MSWGPGQRSRDRQLFQRGATGIYSARHHPCECGFRPAPDRHNDPMIRMATIGTSTITGRFIAAAAEVPAVQVATAYSRDADRAARFAAEMGLTGSACA